MSAYIPTLIMRVIIMSVTISVGSRRCERLVPGWENLDDRPHYNVAKFQYFKSSVKWDTES